MLLAVLAAGCEGREAPAIVRADLPVAPKPTPIVSAPPSVTASASVSTPPPAPSVDPWARHLEFKQRVPLTLATHGFAGHLDVYGEEGDSHSVELLDTVLKLVPKTGAPTHLTFKNAYAPKVTTVVFGDAKQASLLLQDELRWMTGSEAVMAVVEIEDGKLVHRQAQHPTTKEQKAVRVGTTSSGASISTARLHADADAHHELLQVVCGATKPDHTCASVNRVFYVRDQTWWWAERAGTACEPKTNGWCRSVEPFPARSEFPDAE